MYVVSIYLKYIVEKKVFRVMGGDLSILDYFNIFFRVYIVFFIMFFFF